MSVILLHTLKSIGKRPVQTFIIVASVIIAAACFVLMLAMPAIFADCYMLIGGRTFGNADYTVEVNVDGDTDKYASLTELADARFGKNYAVVVELGEQIVQVQSVNMMCAMTLVADLDNYDSVNDTSFLSSSLPEGTDVPEGVFRACVSQYFLEESGLSLGDTFRSVALGEIMVTAVADNTGLYFSHPVPKIVVEADIGTLNTPFSVRVFDCPQTDTEAFAYDIQEKGATVYEIADISDFAEDFASERVKTNMPAVYVAALLIVLAMIVLLRLACASVTRSRAEELVRFKAAGATPAQCMLILLGESALYTVAGALLGLGFGKLLIDSLMQGFRLADALSVSVAPWTYAVAFVLACATGISAAAASSLGFVSKSATRLLSSRDKPLGTVHPVFPAVFAVAALAFGIAPVFATGAEVYAYMVLFLCFACLFTATVMPYAIRFVRFAYGRIRGSGAACVALDNSVKSPAVARTTTALALLISFVFTGSMLISVVNVLSRSNATRFASDYVVRADGAYTLEQAETFAEGLKDSGFAEKVEITAPVYIKFRLDSTKVDFQTATMVGIGSGESLRRFCKDIDDETVRRFDDENVAFPVVINYSVSREFGLEVGDEMRFPYTEYLQDEVAVVVGIDYTASNYDIYIYTRFSVTRPMAAPTTLYLDTDGTENVEALADYCESNGAYLFEGDNYTYDSTSFSMNGLLSAFGTIIYVAAAMGLVNLIAISSAERKREREVFRLAGFAPCDSARFCLSEVVTIVLLGGIAGTVYALAVTSVLRPFSRVLGKYVAGYVSALPLLPIALTACALTLVCWLAFNLAPTFFADIRRSARKRRGKRPTAEENRRRTE